MLIIENNHPPMRKLTQPWKLRRSFGSQPVGNVDGPRWTEAGITAREIPAQSSRWTFRGQSDGDLATWRLGDLATWRLAYLTQATAQTFPSPSTPRSGIRRQPFLQATHALPGPSNCSDVFSDATARHYLPIAIPSPL